LGIGDKKIILFSYISNFSSICNLNFIHINDLFVFKGFGVVVAIHTVPLSVLWILNALRFFILSERLCEQVMLLCSYYCNNF